VGYCVLKLKNEKLPEEIRHVHVEVERNLSIVAVKTCKVLNSLRIKIIYINLVSNHILNNSAQKPIIATNRYFYRYFIKIVVFTDILITFVNKRNESSNNIR